MGFYDKCCCCIDLRTGCLIIGYVSLVIEIIALIVTALVTIAGGAVFAFEQNPDSHVENNNVGVILLVIAAVLFLIVIFAMAFTIVLLVGIHQNKRGHVKTYLICSIILLALFVIQFIVFLFLVPIKASSVIKDILTIVLSFYYLFVIRQYYLQMKSNNRGPAVYNA